MKSKTTFAVLCAVTLLCINQAQATFFTGLEAVSGSTYVRAVSADGSTVVGMSGSQAFRWTSETGMVSLGLLPGHFESSAHAVSADGSVIVGRSRGVGEYGQYEAFRWTSETGMVALGFLPDHNQSSAGFVSADGSVVIGSCDYYDDMYQAFYWTSETGMVALRFSPRGYSYTSAISADGSAVVGSFCAADGYNCEAFRWTTETGMVGLGELPGDAPSSCASAVSADGSVVVGSSDRNVEAEFTEPFRWTAETGMVSLGVLPGNYWNSARAVSADGSVVVGESCGGADGCRGFRWTAETGMVSLGDLPGLIDSYPRAISADGSVVVGTAFYTEDYRSTVFIWDSTNGMRSLKGILVNEYRLDLTDCSLTEAIGISADGNTIVGNGSKNGRPQLGWIANIQPNFTVTATASAGGVISPESSEVSDGETSTFTITPNSGFSIDTVTGCGGTLSGDVYTTGPVTSSCTVSATFKEVVTQPAGGENGSGGGGGCFIGTAATRLF